MRSTTPLRCAAALLALAATAACDDPFATYAIDGRGGELQGVGIERVADGFDAPSFLTSPPGDARLYVAEWGGRIRIIENGIVLPQPFLDVAATGAGAGDVRGIAFDPDYATNRRVFVAFLGPDAHSWIDAYLASADGYSVVPGSRKEILRENETLGGLGGHGAGQIEFGPDGMLWIALGDGGKLSEEGEEDPFGNGQDKETLLGSILRIDVRGGDPYAIPPDNPFRSGGGRPEIWAYGFRNPWRFSFHPTEPVLITPDVGGSTYEEVSLVPTRAGGRNFGWSSVEGLYCRDGCVGVPPVIAYGREDGCAVIGGHVYTGKAVPALAGRYVYGDFCQHWIRTAVIERGLAREPAELSEDRPGSLTSFGLDAEGELYFTTLEGGVYRFIARPSEG